ncbi:MAG: aminotransferase class V-fold PLP-dependent enzyme [Gemmatimonadetes bacterium]|nr:aminotransferase class V-fold PLP-dependent enzyme [Gemmatimonadota bacterium]
MLWSTSTSCTPPREPLDVKASGIDFAACSSFKWLMGDFGLGFLYAREEVWDKVTRPVVSYYQAASAEPNYPPHLPVGAYEPVTYEFSRNAAGLFEMGSLTGSAEVGVALLASSLVYVQALGPANIQAPRLPLIARLQQEMPRLGFAAVTPAGATSGIVTFARKGLLRATSQATRRGQDQRARRRQLDAHLPSVYNDMADIERLLEALS